MKFMRILEIIYISLSLSLAFVTTFGNYSIK